MALRNATAVHFSGTGLSDSLDPTDHNPGAMASLANLIFDPTTADLFQCRPAATKLTSFASFTTPGVISVLQVVGSRVFGLVASGRTAGYDEPFCFDLTSNTFVTVSGITSLNVPLTPSTSGNWVPPTMAVVGTKVFVTHPGFTVASGNYIGWFDISTPATPSWHAGNTATTALAYPATAVAQFGQRAYYIVNPPGTTPGLYASNVLDGTTITNANYILTFGDNIPLTAMAGLPLNNQLGGIIQSLIVFKGATQLYQVTGDPATGAAAGPWTINTMNVATGTLSPRSITTTPIGMSFVAPDGLRTISFTGQVSPPIGFAGAGVTVPFINPAEPTRICTAASAAMIRISVKRADTTWAEYWYDIPRQAWTGPHSFPATAIAPYNNTFILAGVGLTASLWQSDIVQSGNSTFTENGVPLSFTWQTSMLGDLKTMNEYTMVETTLNASLVGSQTNAVVLTVNALDQNGVVRATGLFRGSSATWGSVTWGQFQWGGVTTGLYPLVVPWQTPVVFRRLAIQAMGPSVAGIKIGDLNLRYQRTGYIQQ